MKDVFGYRSILLTAIVSGLFSAVVSALLLVDAVTRLSKVPLEAPQFVALREQFVDQPNNDELRAQIQDLDLKLRQEYFREQRFTEIGSYLLLGGVGLTLVMGRWAATIRRKLPAPRPRESGPDSDARLSRSGIWAVGALIIALLGTTWVMKANSSSSLPATLDELTALRKKAEDQPNESDAVDNTITSTPSVPALPSPEEVRQSWPSFRGPDGSGISRYSNIPITWDGETGEGVLWKTPIPLPGANSPIVWKDRVFLSGATADRREVYCIDAATGTILWQKEVLGQGAKGSEPLKVNQDTGFAAPTMATDGRFVFALFASGDVVAFDFAGNQLWEHSLGTPKNPYGHASSLASFHGTVIIQFDQGSAKDPSKLLAIDGFSGQTVWEVNRAMPASWSSPIVVEHNGQPLIVTCGDPWVIAYSPHDGKEIWRANCLQRAEIGPSPVYVDGTVFVGNDGAPLSAIGADGSGDVTDTHVLWSADIGVPDTCSPLVTETLVLVMASYGTLSCYDKKEGGDPIWEEDFEADFLSSPSLVGDRVYLFSKEGAAWIVNATREACERIAEANLGEACASSPAFQDGRIYLRGKEHLFCIGSEK